MPVRDHSRWWLAAGALTLVISASAAGAGAGEPVRAMASDAAVTVKSFQFTPAELTVAAGTTVTWTNQDKIFHSATSGTPGAPDGRFNGEMPAAGASFSTKLDAPGVYEYFCSRHESMVGKVTVQ